MGKPKEGSPGMPERGVLYRPKPGDSGVTRRLLPPHQSGRTTHAGLHRGAGEGSGGPSGMRFSLGQVLASLGGRRSEGPGRDRSVYRPPAEAVPAGSWPGGSRPVRAGAGGLRSGRGGAALPPIGAGRRSSLRSVFRRVLLRVPGGRRSGMAESPAGVEVLVRAVGGRGARPFLQARRTAADAAASTPDRRSQPLPYDPQE